MNMHLAVQPQERRRDFSQTVKALEAQRQNTLSAFHNMISTDPAQQSSGEVTDITIDKLQEFLTQMVDYITMGHVTVYQRIVDGKERRMDVNEISQQVYPGIGETTDALVEFYDKYEYFDGLSITQKSLKEDSSILGETLSIRAELEDELLTVLAR